MCALGLKKHAVVICGDGVFRNGARAGGSRFGFPNLDRLRAGQTAGVLVDAKCQLRLYVNGVDQGRYSIDILNFRCKIGPSSGTTSVLKDFIQAWTYLKTPNMTWATFLTKFWDRKNVRGIVPQGVAVRGVTANTFYGVADVYGQCEEVTIVPADDDEDGNGMVSV